MTRTAPLPSLESLRCFTVAARTLNFRAAAKAVALTPAAFGQRIKLLEQQLGEPLFRRTTRTVSLTDAGFRLLPTAERCLQAAVDVMAIPSPGVLRTPAMDVVLGTRHELGMSFVLGELDSLTRALPEVQVHLYFGSGEDLLLRLRTLEVDCAITSTRLSDPKLESIELHEEAYAFVASKTLLAQTPLARAEHAANHLLFDTSADTPLFRYFREAKGAPKLSFRAIVRLGTIGAIRARVLAARGVAVLPRYLVAKDLAKGTLNELFPRTRLRDDYFRLVFRADDARRAVYERMAEVLAAAKLR